VTWRDWVPWHIGPPAPARSVVSFQDWVDLFKFAGNTYGLLNTTMGQVSEEQVTVAATQAYKANGPVFALVMARLQVFSQARFVWTRFDGAVPGELFGDQQLGILEKPWAGGVTADLLARMEVDASGAGNAFIRRTSSTRLNRLPPQWVTIVLGSDEDADHPSEAGDVELVGYMYRPPNSRPVAIEPQFMAHYAPLPDPDAHFRGMSWITPVLREIAADNAAVIHKDRFFRNAATPNLAIKFDPAVSIENVRAFKALLEEEHQGAWNAYKTLYLGGGGDPIPIGKDFQQIDFAKTQGKGESRLASAAGVPPSWVGFSEGLAGSALNAGNFGASRRRYADGTMQHLWTNAARSLGTIVTPGPRSQGASLWFDARAVPFLREDAKDAAEIQSRQATTINDLIREGWEPESAVAAVIQSDWKLLKHTGLVSVQLQPPGTQDPAQTVTESNSARVAALLGQGWTVVGVEGRGRNGHG
jgi:phage portal protein BeeE